MTEKCTSLFLCGDIAYAQGCQCVKCKAFEQARKKAASRGT